MRREAAEDEDDGDDDQSEEEHDRDMDGDGDDDDSESESPLREDHADQERLIPAQSLLSFKPVAAPVRATGAFAIRTLPAPMMQHHMQQIPFKHPHSLLQCSCAHFDAMRNARLLAEMTSSDHLQRQPQPQQLSRQRDSRLLGTEELKTIATSIMSQRTSPTSSNAPTPTDGTTTTTTTAAAKARMRQSYTLKQKIDIVNLALANSMGAVSRATGIPKSMISKWKRSVDLLQAHPDQERAVGLPRGLRMVGGGHRDRKRVLDVEEEEAEEEDLEEEDVAEDAMDQVLSRPGKRRRVTATAAPTTATSEGSRSFFPQLETTLHEWIIDHRTRRQPLNAAAVQAKMMALVRESFDAGTHPTGNTSPDGKSRKRRPESFSASGGWFYRFTKKFKLNVDLLCQKCHIWGHCVDYCPESGS